jgi:hypothetical protein
MTRFLIFKKHDCSRANRNSTSVFNVCASSTSSYPMQMNSPSVFLGDNAAGLPFSFMGHDSVSSYPQMRTVHDQSEIEVAQLMVSMSSQKPNLFGRSSVPFTPPTPRTFIYHTPTLSYDGDMVKRGRRTSPKKLVLSPSRCPCPNCGVESSTLWRNCDVS